MSISTKIVITLQSEKLFQDDVILYIQPHRSFTFYCLFTCSVAKAQTLCLLFTRNTRTLDLNQIVLFHLCFS